MELLLLLSVALVWGVAVVTPGPNFFITVRSAMAQTRQSALFTVLGITTGTAVWGISGFMGITVLFKTAPWIYCSLKFVGGCYLIYLGVKLMAAKSSNHTGDRSGHLKGVSSWRNYKTGLLTNLSNPKSAAFVTSLFAATMPADVTFFVGLVSVLLMLFISTVWYTMVAFVFSLDRFKNIYQRSRNWIEKTAGTIFIGFGAKLAVSD